MTEDMTNSSNVYEFVDYLDKLSEMISIFKGVVTSSEVMGELPLTEEQIEIANIYLEKLQKDWSETFIGMMKLGVEWLEKNNEDLK